MFRSIFFRSLLMLLLSCTPSFAQSLADVLSSIQERKQALEQRTQVIWHLTENYSPDPPNADTPQQNLIVWDGVSAFPTDEDTNGLSVDARIKLLNQAVLEFRPLQKQYINLRKEDLAQGSKFGALRPFMLEDFAEPGRVEVGNYHAVLRHLASSVRQLTVLEWSFAGLKQTIRTGQPNSTAWEIGSYGSLMLEDCNVTGGTGGLDQQVLHYKDVALFAATPGLENQLNGKVGVVVRNHWSPATTATITAVAPTSWDPEDGSCQIGLLKQNPDNVYSMGADPQITVATFLVPQWEGSTANTAVPLGYQVQSPGGLFATNTWEEIKVFNQFGGENIVGAPHCGYYVAGRSVTALFVPTFTKGLDTPGKSELLAKSEKASSTPPGDAKPVLHPSPGILFGIPLGASLDGGIQGMIGITPGEVDWGLLQHSFEKIGTLDGSPSNDLNYPELSYRFDFASSLRFIGPAQEFHVVYETSRKPAKRGATLPAQMPTPQQVAAMGCKVFFRNWDLPRLKQVVSRDFIVDITPQGHYKNEVKIYRRPIAAGPVNRTPGTLTSIEGAELVRTLIIKNPDAENDPYPATPEKLEITGDGATYQVWRTGYSTYNGGLIPPDIHFSVSGGTAEAHTKDMDFQGVGHVTTVTKIGNNTVSSETINDAKWFWYSGMEPANRAITKGVQITNVTNSFPPGDPAWPNEPRVDWYPLSSHITITNEPNIDLTWTTSGRLASAAQGSWKTEYSIDEEGALKAESKFNNTLYATTWTEWSGNGRVIKTYSAPDGSVTLKSAAAVDWSELTLGDFTGTGLPGLPYQLTRKDGNETKWTWTVGADHSGAVKVESGQFSEGNLQTGKTQWAAWNDRSYPTTTTTDLTADDTTLVAFSGASQFTGWGAPEQWQDYLTNLSSVIAYQPGLTRPSSITSPLGLTTVFSNYDVFDRPGQLVSNGITATNTYTALSTTTTYGGTGVVSGSQSSYTRNVEGTSITTGLTWGGVAQSSGTARGASATTITGTHSLLGSSGATISKGDGSLVSATSPKLAFGGVSGYALWIDNNGLLVTKSAVANQIGTSAETHTDAWGRTRKVITPSKSGSGNTETTVDYSLPSSAIKRVITTEPTGRILITESEADGTITRSGIDSNGDHMLKPDDNDNDDRYTESITTVTNGKVVTTLRVTDEGPGVTGGLREVLETKWTPSSGVTETKINGGEETITTTPDYAAKTVTTSSNKGWSKTDSINNIGLATNSTLTGTGIPHAELKPVWRVDGSLESVDFDLITGPNNQKETHTASFNTNGTLATLIAPGRGNILGGHSISNGEESLTVNGVTNTAKLDGTQLSTSGANVIGKTDTLVMSGSGYQKNTHPVIGADTHSNFNAALATTGKTYADNSGETYGYAGELLSSIYLARGGSLALGYSNGAKDLASTVWPAMASGPFTIPSIAHDFKYTRSGQIKTLGDPSGARSLDYQKGRLSATTYTAGLLKGYAIIPGRDTSGRQTGTLLKRYGATIHSTQKAPNGVSDQITNLASGNITATPQRDGAGRITGYIWSDGTNSVEQTWTRGTSGRIEAAGSNVNVAPSFNYAAGENSFDGFGRRLSCTTEGGAWAYIYGTGGQLVSAIHPTLGTFTYSFDGIGRRLGKGPVGADPNTTDVLNRTTAWTNSQNKTLTIHANPAARVWYNGTEIPNFTGTHSATITPPGAEGGWVPWNTLAVIEGAGEGAGNPAANPLASPDAKAEKKGAVWVPPIAETLTYDAAGNRQSSAQWNFGWDAKNQLARARTKDYNTAAQGYDITFTYDAEGRRVKKHVIEYQAGARVSEKIITFVWDGWDLLYERHQLPSGLTTLERKYLWGPDIADGSAGGAGGLLLIRETKGNTTTEIIPLYDGTGHVAALTNINKDLLASYQYGPFGEKISATGPKAQSNPWRWGTKYLDEETGLYYFGRRFFDPITGNWLSREPLGESESINLYLFAGNDPINNVDVQGLAAKDVRQHVDQAQKQLAQLTLAMASLVGSTDGEFETMAEDIEAIYGKYLGSVTAGNDELAKFMQEGWFLSFRSADDDLIRDLGALPTNLKGLQPDQATTRQWMAARSQIGSSISGQIDVLENTHTGLVATEFTGSAILISTGVGAGGIAVKKVLLEQGGKQAAKMVLSGMAKAGGGLAVGFLSEQAMIKAGIKPEHAQMAMKGAELFFAYKMLKVARMASAATKAKKVVPIGEDLSPATGTKVWRNVPEGHGGLADAQASIVKPYGATIDAPLDVRAMGHDIGHTQGSGLTSWSADQTWVLERQKRLGGVVLETIAPDGSLWFNQAAKGAESQVLIPGIIKIR